MTLTETWNKVGSMENEVAWLAAGKCSEWPTAFRYLNDKTKKAGMMKLVLVVDVRVDQLVHMELYSWQISRLLS
jgi:hypothetical protein